MSNNIDKPNAFSTTTRRSAKLEELTSKFNRIKLKNHPPLFYADDEDSGFITIYAGKNQIFRGLSPQAINFLNGAIDSQTVNEDGEAPAAAAGPAITTSSMGPGALYAPKVMGTVSRFGEFAKDRFDQSFMKKMRKKLNEDAAESSAFDSITVGSRVTILTPQKQERSGRAVMRNREQDLWVLNMGGPHGRPGIADRRNFVKVTGNKKKMRVETESADADLEAAYNSGLKAGEASAHNDRGTVSHERNWFRKFKSVKKNRADELQKKWDDGYRENSGAGRKPEYFK